VGLAPGPLAGGEEAEEDVDDDEELADTVGALVVDRGRRRRDRKLDAEEEDADDDAWASPDALGLRKDGAAGKPLRMLALCVLSVGGVGRGCGWLS